MNYLVFMLVVTGISTAQAQVVDPFVASGKEWVAFDSYDKKGSGPSNTTDQTVQEAVKGVESTPKEGEVKGTNERSVSFPVLPAGAVVTEAVPETGADNGIGSHDKKEWSDVAKAEDEARKQAEADQKVIQHTSGGSHSGPGSDPFGVRYATLPSSKVQSIPADRISKPRVEPVAQISKTVGAQAASKKLQNSASSTKPEAEGKQKIVKETNDACEELVDQRRRQLQAIESDRRTLAQLKAALTELGLVKKLSFMDDQTNAYVDSVPAINVTTNQTVKQP